MLNLVSFLDEAGYCVSIVGGDGIPAPIGKIVHLGVLLIQIVVPILLIIWGMLDFAKGVMAQEEDKIKAGQKKFIQRLIAAVIVFLIVATVNFTINMVGSLSGDGNDAANAWSCAKELINGKAAE
ncbi:MAG: hypothetical protein IKF82_08370 [Bacilli bacterium]|nr:hypothetical protein [Bacilli bacterium]